MIRGELESHIKKGKTLSWIEREYKADFNKYENKIIELFDEPMHSEGEKVDWDQEYKDLENSQDEQGIFDYATGELKQAFKWFDFRCILHGYTPETYCWLCHVERHPDAMPPAFYGVPMYGIPVLQANVSSAGKWTVTEPATKKTATPSSTTSNTRTRKVGAPGAK